MHETPSEFPPLGPNEASRLSQFRSATGVPAAIAAIVDRDGSMKTTVEGLRRRSGGDLATVDDQWHIGSCGKMITALLYARLVEAGMAEWGVPVGKLFPDLADEIAVGWDGPTIDNLLHCRAGARANPGVARMKADWADRSSSPAERREAMAATELAEPPSSPGKFVYSNLGYIIAGAAIDRLAGRPYEEALEHFVLEPLGITTLGYGPPPRVWGHGARYWLGPMACFRGDAMSPGDDHSDNPPMFSSAGRMHLSMADWARVMSPFLRQGQPLLVAESVERLLRVPEGKNTMTMGWAPAPPGVGGSFVAQGSNTAWAATALLDIDEGRAVLIIANDGRTRVLNRSVKLASALLKASTN